MISFSLPDTGRVDLLGFDRLFAVVTESAIVGVLVLVGKRVGIWFFVQILSFITVAVFLLIVIDLTRIVDFGCLSIGYFVTVVAILRLLEAGSSFFIMRFGIFFFALNTASSAET